MINSLNSKKILFFHVFNTYGQTAPSQHQPVTSKDLERLTEKYLSALALTF